MKKTGLTILILLVMLIVSTANAGNVDTYGIGSKATALGGAFSAYADDPYAVYYNPAGLTQIQETIISGGFNMISPTIEVENFHISNTDDPAIKGPYDFSDNSDPIIAPHLGLAMPLSSQLYLGVAAYAPWGLDIRWDENPDNNPGAYNCHRSYYYREAVTPTLAYKISEKFSIGFGISLGKSVAGQEHKLYVSPDVGGDPVVGPAIRETGAAVGTMSIGAVEAANQEAGGLVPTITTTTAAYNFLTTYAPEMSQEAAVFKSLADRGLETPEQIGTAEAAKYSGVKALDHDSVIVAELEDDFNYSFNIGVMYRPMDSIAIGLTYRSRTSTDFEGELYKNDVWATDGSIEFDHPEQVQMGIRYVPESYKNISIEFDLVWTHWSINDTQALSIDPALEIDVIPGVSGTREEVVYRRDWEDTKQVRVGVEWKINETYTLRGGYFYDPSPIPDDTLDLVWPDADKKTYSLGCGMNFGKFTVDAVVQYTDIEKARYVGGESDNLNDSYAGAGENDTEVSFEADGKLWGAGVTVSYRF